MPWQGDSSVTIDRFDGRAHLDFIAEHKPAPNAADNDEDVVSGLNSKERREVMYERYRILVQNDFSFVDSPVSFRHLSTDTSDSFQMSPILFDA